MEDKHDDHSSLNGSMVKSNNMLSKASISLEWKDKVMEMEMKELEKLEKILH